MNMIDYTKEEIEEMMEEMGDFPISSEEILEIEELSEIEWNGYLYDLPFKK